jgi:hypothetical protein
MRLDPAPESPFVLPVTAGSISGLRPFVLRNLMTPDPATGVSPAVRSVRVRGRRLVRLDDVLAAAGARTATGKAVTR